MTYYYARRLTYRPLLLDIDAEQIEALGMSPAMITESTGPDAVVVYCVETAAAHPTTPILPSIDEFHARYEAIEG